MDLPLSKRLQDVFSTGAEESNTTDVTKCLQATKSSHTLPQLVLKRRSHPILHTWKVRWVKLSLLVQDLLSSLFSAIPHLQCLPTTFQKQLYLSINHLSFFTEAKTDLRDTPWIQKLWSNVLPCRTQNLYCSEGQIPELSKEIQFLHVFLLKEKIEFILYSREFRY